MGRDGRSLIMHMTTNVPAPRMQNRPTEPPVKHIAVVGGGATAWMTALLLSTSTFGARLTRFIAW